VRLRALATWPDHELAGLGIPRGKCYLVLKLNEDFIAAWGAELGKLKARKVERWQKAMAHDSWAKYEDSLFDLQLDLQIFYKKRSVQANALLWQLYTIEANWANGTPTYRDAYLSKRLPGHVITSEDIHQDDLEVYCKKTAYFVERADVAAFARGMELADIGRVMKKEPVTENTFKVEVWKTTSFLDTKEFSEWTSRVIDRIKFGGLLNSDVTEFLLIKNQFQEILANGQKGKRK